MGRRRIPFGFAAIAILVAALALQPVSAAAGLIALGLTAVVATVLWLVLP